MADTNTQTIDETIKSLNKMKDSMGSLSELMEGTQQVSDGLLNSFKDFATAGSSSTLWSAVSRFTSGIFPGFWSLQNKIRSVAVYMQYVEKKQKEQIKKEGQIAKTIDQQSKVRIKAFSTLNKLTNTNSNIIDKLQLKEDKYYKVLVAQIGEKKAKIKYEKQYRNTLLENIKGELSLSKTVTDRIRNDKDNAKFFKQVRNTEIVDLQNILFYKDKEEEINKQITELNNTRAKKGQGEIKKEQLKALREELADAQMSQQLLSDESGISISGDDVSVNKKTGGNPFTEFGKKIAALLESIGPIGAVIKGFKWISKKQNVRLMLGYFQKGLWVLGKFMLYATGLGIVIFLIHKSGVIQKIISFFAWAREEMPEWFDGLSKYFGWIFSGLYDFFIGWFNFFHAAFTGDGEKLSNAIAQIIEGASKFLVGVILTSFMTMITVMGTIAGSIIKNLWDIAMGAESVAGTIGGAIGGMAGGYAGMKTGAALGSFFGPVGTVVGGIAGAMIGSQGGGNLGVMAGDALMGMHTGGLTPMAGNYLVGERGPEMINLPAGAKVTPNNQMRNSGVNNITVNVNGRLGASDSELREVAQKVGRMINLQLTKQHAGGIIGGR